MTNDSGLRIDTELQWRCIELNGKSAGTNEINMSNSASSLVAAVWYRGVNA
jgi:hypothetical protein